MMLVGGSRLPVFMVHSWAGHLYQIFPTGRQAANYPVGGIPERKDRSEAILLSCQYKGRRPEQTAEV